MTDARSPMRALRAAIFAAVCVALATLGHSYQSGREIPLSGVLAAFTVTGTAAWLAGGRRRGTLPVAAGLVAVQAALHLIFAGSRPGAAHPHHDPAMADTAGMPGMPGMAGAARAAVTAGARAAADGTAATGGAAAHTDTAALAATGHGSATMLLAHLLAAALCGLWLARGEAALFRLLRALDALAFTPLRLLLAAVRPAPRAPRPVPRAARARVRRPRGALLAHALTRRGPPPHPGQRGRRSESVAQAGLDAPDLRPPVLGQQQLDRGLGDRRR
ncbi:hypothetical protein, partial [Streptomyces sp. GC420]|uniref:hypothetical protein n=1 Tax=Streptomyces sp. GC420 TaxID=2697568 RepID=UPI001AA1B60B